MLRHNDISEGFEIFPWHKSFDTGNEKIDSQHKKIVKLLNRLANSMATEDTLKVNIALHELSDYVDFHFSDEEKLWNQYFTRDEWLTSHERAHASFLPKVLELKRRQYHSEDRELVEDIIRFLMRWLAFHIIESDKRMSFAVDAMRNGASLGEAKSLAEKKISGTTRDLVEAILSMYEGVSTATFEMIRERNARLDAEDKLSNAYIKSDSGSITDKLTGLKNRSYMNEIIPIEIAKAARKKRPIAVHIIDIDKFKRFNNLYGHIEGDEVLKKVSLTIETACRRPTDYVFRFQKDIFCVIEVDVDIGDDVNFSNNIKNKISELQIPHEGNDDCGIVTVSIGSVVIIPNPKDTLDNVIELACNALCRSQ